MLYGMRRWREEVKDGGALVQEDGETLVWEEGEGMRFRDGVCGDEADRCLG
jgi:hypothetical protein